MMVRKCKNCNKEFNVESPRKFYCSAECRYEFKRKKKPATFTKVCAFCGNIFETSTKKTKFCSMKCNGLNVSAKAKERAFFNIEAGKKKCSKCGEIKKISDFYNVKGRNGMPSWCKKCKLDQNKKYSKNPEVAANKKLWREKYNLSTKDLRKISRMRRIYGISFEEYMGLLSAQSGNCAICKNKLNSEDRGIQIDHCHNSDKIRGLLCKKCNLGLGFFNDNKESLMSAIQYLDIHK